MWNSCLCKTKPSFAPVFVLLSGTAAGKKASAGAAKLLPTRQISRSRVKQKNLVDNFSKISLSIVQKRDFFETILVYEKNTREIPLLPGSS